MYDPLPDKKDQFISTFENLIGRKQDVDETLREEVQQNLDHELKQPTHVSQDN